ncbi:MAG: hypothetical protein JST92_26605, partial [Deltaproteobacteria bacterium]|nr:hypothetical protein [Deltaproteobacteria bacterium]
CEGDVGPLPYEICNGIDDNCDGTVDEVADKNGKPIMVRPSCSKTEGVCAGAVKRCVNGAFATCDDSDYLSAALANGSAYGPDVNYCDGADHDCDGTSDTGCTGCPVLGATRDCYGPGLNSPTLHHTPCRKGTETCVRSGNTSKWGVCSGQVEPTSEICDGVDNDCDGNVDDLVKNEGTLCNTGKPGVCGPGVRRCVNGNLDCTSITPASTEVCNGLDDDCDGRIDQTFDKLHDPQHCGGVNECVQCASGDACCDGRCADLRSDSNDCGTCGNVCAPGSGCCAGVCVDLSSDTSCGACTIECKDGESCKNGACQGTKEVRCDNGLDDDGDHLTDCADPDCAGLRCDQVGGTCQSGQCVHETNCSNGVDDDHNGKTDCADPACTGQRCAGNGICTVAGACVKEICDNGIDDNGDGKIDCQDSLACPPPVAGTGLPIQEACCGVKWADLLGDVANCGGCGNDCRAGHDATCGTIACVQGRCAYNTSSNGTTCNGSGKCCDGACIGSFDHGDPNNCGGCGVKCPAPTGACQEAVCNAGGHCGFAPSCEVASCDLQSCITGGQAGLCTDGACCTGCVDSASDLCKGGTDLHACRGPTGYCADCATSNNPCITDACGPNGCTHNANSSACDVNGQAGTCNNGACCIGCIDAGGACHQIDSTHCGVPGGACVLSCDDGESCTQDLCHSTGTGAPFCTNPGLPDGAGCVSANKGGVCQGASCCTGCLDISSNGSAACLALGSQSATKCGASGVSCQTCPAPGECQSASTCTNGTCGFTNKPDGTLCRGGLGFCSGGQCKL